MTQEVSTETESLLALLRSFHFPEGEDFARLICAAATAESGSLQIPPGARAIPFTAKQRTDSTCSRFLWKLILIPAK